MSVERLPSKVVREGGTVISFDEPRRAFKKVSDERVATLIVPTGERIVYPVSSGSWNNPKLRTERVIVDEIEGETDTARSIIDGETLYRVGHPVEPHEFCDDVEQVSAPGIHCFATRKGAEHWGRAE